MGRESAGIWTSFGFRVSGFGFRVLGSAFMGQESVGIWTSLGFRVSGSEFRVYGPRERQDFERLPFAHTATNHGQITPLPPLFMDAYLYRRVESPSPHPLFMNAHFYYFLLQPKSLALFTIAH